MNEYKAKCVSGNRCPPVPHLVKAEANTSVTNQGTIVLFTCKPGHQFPDGHNMKIANCNGQLTWTGINNKDECHREFLHVDVKHKAINVFMITILY